MGDFGPKCDHGRQPTFSFRFQLVLYDAIHAGVRPVHVQVWDTTTILLGYSATNFNLLSVDEQTFHVHGLTLAMPRARMSLYVKNFEVKVNHLIFVNPPPVLTAPPSFKVT